MMEPSATQELADAFNWHFLDNPKKRVRCCVTLVAFFLTVVSGGLLLMQGVKTSQLVFGSSLSVMISPRDSSIFQVSTETGAKSNWAATGEAESPGRTAYVMLAHHLNQSVVDELEHLASDLDSRDVFLVYDGTETPLFSGISKLQNFRGGLFTPEEALFGGILSVNEQRLREISPWFESAREHIQTLLVAFYRSVVEREPSYQYVWFLESDVRCNGNYARTFGKADGHVADFLGLWTAGKTDTGPPWGLAAREDWNWHRLEGIPMEDRWGAFLPVMRLSRKGLRGLSDSAVEDISGFCEVYIPTVVHLKGGEMGSLPDEMLAGGDYRYRPQMTQAEYENLRQNGPQDVLYHPVVDYIEQPPDE